MDSFIVSTVFNLLSTSFTVIKYVTVRSFVFYSVFQSQTLFQQYIYGETRHYISS